MASQADYSVLARSPIEPAEPVTEVAGWLVSARRSDAELTLTDLTPLAKVQFKATPDGELAELLGARLGTSAIELTTAGAPPIHLATGAGPGEWLLIAAPNTAADLVAWGEKLAASVAELVSVVDLTHGRALLRLTGRRAADLLAKVCAIDLSDEVTPDGAAFRSSVARLATDVVRRDTGRGPSYLLHCERSSGQYLYRALLDAGAEYDVEPAGFQHDEWAATSGQLTT